MLQKKCFLFILFIGFYSNTYSNQNCSFKIKGTIIDHDQNQILEGAKVWLEENQMQTISDQYGKFIFNNICNGRYTLHISSIGFKEYVENIVIKSNWQHKFRLHADTCILHDIEILEINNHHHGLQIIDELNEKDIVNNQGSSIGELVSKIAGVNLIQTGAAVFKPMIHGMYASRVATINMDVRQEGNQWGLDHGLEIDPLTADRVSIVQGPQAIKYSTDAIGGALIVDSKPIPIDDTLRSVIGTGFHTNNRLGFANGKINGRFLKVKNLGFQLQGSMRKAGNYYNPNGYLTNTGFDEKNFSGRLNYKFKNLETDFFYSLFQSKIGIFSITHALSFDDLTRAINGNPNSKYDDFTYTINRPYQLVQHELSRLKSTWWINPNFNLKLVLARQYNQRDEYDRTKPRNNARAALNLPDASFFLTTHSADIQLENNHKYGTTALNLVNEFQKNSINGQYLVPWYKSNKHGLVASHLFKVNQFDIELISRYDYKNLVSSIPISFNEVKDLKNTFQGLSSSGSVSYHLRQQTCLNFQLGYIQRNPNISELYSKGVDVGIGRYVIGNANFQNEKSLQFLFNIQHNTNKIDFKTSIYNFLTKDYMYLNPRKDNLQTIRGAFPVFEYIQSNVNHQGFDVDFKYKFTKSFSSFIQASVIRGYNISKNDFLIFTPANRITFGSNFNINTLSTVKFEFSPSIQLVSKQYLTPANTDLVDAPDGYYLINCSANIDFIRKKQDPIKLVFEARNLTNNSYTSYLSRYRYYAQDQGFNFVTRLIIPIKTQPFKQKQK